MITIIYSLPLLAASAVAADVPVAPTGHILESSVFPNMNCKRLYHEPEVVPRHRIPLLNSPKVCVYLIEKFRFYFGSSAVGDTLKELCATYVSDVRTPAAVEFARSLATLLEVGKWLGPSDRLVIVGNLSRLSGRDLGEATRVTELLGRHFSGEWKDYFWAKEQEKDKADREFPEPPKYLPEYV
jgi:hypothetical protein